ncbi:ABC transporter ATP-binding protein [Micromonospora sp. NPDC047074]|uniref:ABC transporter ATP-binding protein n=1 Tax=Micromonospora sp. NPDC047074 TaxID=3154339 RepID=UPI00340DE57D
MPRAGRRTLAVAVVLQVVCGVLPVVFAVSISVVLSRVPEAVGVELTSPAGRGLAVGLALAAGAVLVQQMLVPVQTAVGELVTRRVDGYCAQLLMSACARADSIAALEDPAVQDQLNDIRTPLKSDWSTPGGACAGWLALIARYAQLTAAVAVVAVVFSPVAAAVLGIVALVIRFGTRGSLRRFGDLNATLAGSRRRLLYLFELLTGPSAAKELRLFAALPWLRDRYRTEFVEHLSIVWAGRRRIMFAPFLRLAGVGLLGAGAVLASLAWSGAHGQLTLLQLVVAIQAVLVPIRFGVHFPESDVQTMFGLNSLRALDRVVAATGAGSGGPEQKLDDTVTLMPAREIRFAGVSFGYPGSDRDVLRGVDITLPAGTSTAIVGLNGAGKTTLIKLLTKLYQPDSGQILVDGRDLTELDSRAWQRRLAVLFQDFSRYELPARDNIGFGSVEHLDDLAAMRRAAERADAAGLLDALPDGLDTTLSRRYQGGTDLSGGQWQRVAMARALFAVEQGAGVLVLDEPTAQLDVRTEAEYFQRVLAQAQGLTTVVISHRFSTVRHADQIVVLDDGRIVERGSHAELMASGGRYAELFQLQARQFAEEGIRLEPEVAA